MIGTQELAGGCCEYGFDKGNGVFSWEQIVSGGLDMAIGDDTLRVHDSDNSRWAFCSLAARLCSDGSF